MNNIWDEVTRLVAEYDASRPKLVKEYRLYYDSDGTIIGLWESSHPEGDNYIVLDDPGLFHRSNTHMLRVQNKKLVVLEGAGHYPYEEPGVSQMIREISTFFKK